MLYIELAHFYSRRCSFTQLFKTIAKRGALRSSISTCKVVTNEQLSVAIWNCNASMIGIYLGITDQDVADL